MMTKSELMSYVGKKVCVYFKGEEKGVHGTLGYTDEFSAKYDWRKRNYFFISNTLFMKLHTFISVISAETSKNFFTSTRRWMKFIIARIKKYIFKIKSPSRGGYEWDYLINKYFDYEIVGEYYDNDGKGHLYKKYNRRYFRRKTK